VAYYQKLRQTDIPDPRSGKLTARPSGKFCIPIPIARFLHQNNVNYTIMHSNGCEARESALENYLTSTFIYCFFFQITHEVDQDIQNILKTILPHSEVND